MPLMPLLSAMQLMNCRLPFDVPVSLTHPLPKPLDVRLRTAMPTKRTYWAVLLVMPLPVVPWKIGSSPWYAWKVIQAPELPERVKFTPPLYVPPRTQTVSPGAAPVDPTALAMVQGAVIV